MKKLYSILFAVLLLLASCAKDPDLATPEIPDPIPTPDSHVVPVEAALAELQAVLGNIDGQTRSGGSRSVAGVISVRAADVLPAIRTGETADVEDLVYIANFEGGEGYAILGADDRLATVIAITEQGSLTPEEFAAVARGEYSAEGEIPPVFPDVVNYAMGLGGGIGGGGGTIGGDGGGPTITPPFTDLDTEGELPSTLSYNRHGPWEQIVKRGPYIQTKWHQGVPYNFYAPVKNGVHCQVGCVAVALGQIMASNAYYSKRLYLGKIGGYNPTYWLDLFCLIDLYISNPETKRYHDETSTSGFYNIAMLLRGIGNEVDMDYGVNGSGATDNKAHNFLEDIGYKNAKTFDYTESRTRMMIVERGFPVYVSGYDSTAKKGHAWVIDGVLQQHRLVERVIKVTSIVLDSHMEARTLFHCNFGWKGQCDGYYYAATFFQLSLGPTSTEGPMDIDKGRDRRYAKDKVIITYTGW